MKKYVKAAKFTVKGDYFFPVKRTLDAAISDARNLEFAKRGIDDDIADKAEQVVEILQSAKMRIESIGR